MCFKKFGITAAKKSCQNNAFRAVFRLIYLRSLVKNRRRRIETNSISRSKNESNSWRTRMALHKNGAKMTAPLTAPFINPFHNLG